MNKSWCLILFNLLLSCSVCQGDINPVLRQTIPIGDQAQVEAFLNNTISQLAPSDQRIVRQSLDWLLRRGKNGDDNALRAKTQAWMQGKSLIDAVIWGMQTHYGPMQDMIDSLYRRHVALLSGAQDPANSPQRKSELQKEASAVFATRELLLKEQEQFLVELNALNHHEEDFTGSGASPSITPE